MQRMHRLIVLVMANEPLLLLAWLAVTRFPYAVASLLREPSSVGPLTMKNYPGHGGNRGIHQLAFIDDLVIVLIMNVFVRMIDWDNVHAVRICIRTDNQGRQAKLHPVHHHTAIVLQAS